MKLDVARVLYHQLKVFSVNFLGSQGFGVSEFGRSVKANKLCKIHSS